MSRTTSPQRLLIIQPAVPEYRVAFFERAIDRLRESGIETTIATGGYDNAGRGDEARRDWITPVSDRLGASRPWRLRWRRWSESVPQPDLVILEQALKNVEAYPLLVHRRLGGPRIAMWGQGRAYSTAQSPALAAAKQFLTRRCDWFFAYTQAGADHVMKHGFPARRVSVLNNTIDTEALQRDLDAVSAGDLATFMAHHGLCPGRTALFLGGVDLAKGIGFLVESARYAEAALPGFILLVGGAGSQLDDVRAAQRSGAPVRALGRLDGREKAIALRAADLLAIPEWIGLVSVDSLVAGKPIVSTTHPSHSPESEYLRPGASALFAEHDTSAYAAAMTELLGQPERLLSMQRAARSDAPKYSLRRMVDSFVDGVNRWRHLD